MTGVFFALNQNVCRSRSGVQFFVVILAMLGTAAPSAMAARVINSIALNGGAPWTFNNDGSLNIAGATASVAAGDTIAVTMTVTTDGNGNNNNWSSSSWRISNITIDPFNCVDTNNHTSSGTFVETFNITAPLAVGTLSSAFIAHGNTGGLCGSNGQSAVVSLSSSITVLPPPPNPPLTQGCGLDVVLVIDLSGSIDPIFELPQIRAAAHAFVNSLLPGTPSEIGIVTFSTTATTVSNLSSNAASLNTTIDGITTTGGTTNWEAALSTATSLLEGGLDRDDAQHPDLIVILTDGQPTVPIANPLQAAVTAANAAKTSSASLPIRILAVGIGLGDPPGAGFIANLVAITGPTVTPPAPGTQDTDVVLSDFGSLAGILANVGVALCGGTITVHKVIDQDGDLQTTGDQITAGAQVSGWTITANVTNGTPTPASGQTDGSGLLNFDLLIPNVSATVQLVETVSCGSTLIGATCTGATTNGTFNAAGHSINGIVIQNNNIVQCTFFNTLDDPNPLIVVCPSAASASANANCLAPVPNFVPQVQATDDCTPANQLVITQNPVAGTLVGKGSTAVTITVTDGDNNVATCMTSFTVNDTTSPNITSCASPQSVSANGTCQASVPDFRNGIVVTDNCVPLADLIIIQEPPPGTIVGVGVHTITITVSDGPIGPESLSSCSTTFTVSDTTPPIVVTCPPTQNIFANGSCEAQVPDLSPLVVASDNCTPAGQLIINQDPPAGTIIQGPTNSVTVTITVMNPDDGMTSSPCEVTVNVSDNMAAVLTMCAGPATVVANEGTCLGTLGDLRPLVMATDNCSFTVGQIPPPGTQLGVGPHNVQLTVTDPSGLPAANSPCTAVVTVVDETPPVITQCATSQPASADAECEGLVPDFTGDVIATDSCTSSENLVITQDPPVDTAVGLGVHVITITVTDEAGNSAMCTVNFTVTDDTAPQINCPQDINVTNTGNGDNCRVIVEYEVTATDNCPPLEGGGGLTPNCNFPSGTSFPVGVTSVDCSVMDAAGHTSSCSFTVTVVDGDEDADGVSNCNDECPGTVQGDPVDADGCSCAQVQQQSEPLDSDGDGVSDACDVCPGTPVGEPVDADGCSCSQEGGMDSDGDGVPDICDLCPDTPGKTPVDGNGCSCDQLDSDNDGVNNCIDLCPNTPQGSPVDEQGCACGEAPPEGTAQDSDGDGVPNACDLCPDTPTSQPVDEDGCSCEQLDGDGDGVNDCIDDCPNTPEGDDPGADGCSCNETDQGDCNGNGINDDCETDCNNNGIPDDCDIASGTSEDCNDNGIPDSCDPDQDNDGISNDCDNCRTIFNPGQTDLNGNGIGDLCEPVGPTPTQFQAPPVDEPPPPQDNPPPCDIGMSLLFSVLSGAPVCGMGCLTMVPVMILGLMQMRGSRRVRRNRRVR